MKSIELTKATGPLAEYAATLSEGPIVVTKGGRPVAALISVRKSDLESLLVSNNQRFQAILKKSRAEYRRKGGISPAEMRERLRKPTGA